MAIEIQAKNPTIQMGIPGPRGERGPKGDPFTYDDFTAEQLEQLKGPKGDPGPTYTAGENITISADNVISATGGGSGGSVPKPLAYDYMPEGYPSKAMGTMTLMEEQELAFKLNKGKYMSQLTPGFKVVEGQTYAVNWDGTEYECVGVISNSMPMLGNLSIMNMGDDTGEPFLYAYNKNLTLGMFATIDASASHTIGVKTTGEIVTPMAEEFLPASVGTAALIYYNSRDKSCSSELTYDELYERLLGGKQVVLFMINDNEYSYLTKWTNSSTGDILLTFGGTYNVTLLTDGTLGLLE